jgi:hypothetical protein
VFQHNQSAPPPSDDPTKRISPSPQINATAPGSSADSQPIQNQGVGDKDKDPAATMLVVQTYPTQSNVQGETFSLQNEHKNILQ